MDALVVVKVAEVTTQTQQTTAASTLEEKAQKMLRQLSSTLDTQSKGVASARKRLTENLKKRLTLLISRSQNTQQKALYEAVLERIK